MRVHPLSQGELTGVREDFVEAFLADPAGVVAGAGSSQTTRASYIERVVAGGFPLALSRTAAARGRWFDDMVRASLERDLRELAKLRQAALLPNLLERLAAQTAQALNVSRAARETSPRSPIDEKTAESWIRLTRGGLPDRPTAGMGNDPSRAGHQLAEDGRPFHARSSAA